MSKLETKDFLATADVTVVDAMKRLDKTAKGVIFIIDSNKTLIGSVSDGDIRRWVIKTGDLMGQARSFMHEKTKCLTEKERDKAESYMKTHHIRVVPILNEERKVIDIIFDTDVMSRTAKKEKGDLSTTSVIIMAGGKGTRLYPYTKILPKPLIPIGDVPIIERIIDKFCEYNIVDFHMTVNYKKAMIKSYFTDLEPKYNVSYVEEDKPLGTAGSIRLIHKKFHSPVIVTNCDILVNADYANIMKHHKKSGNAMTIVSALKNVIVPYGVLRSKEDGIITSMEEKPSLSYLVNTGMYVINPEIIEMIQEDTYFHMPDLADKLMKVKLQVGMYPISEDSFFDMGEFEEMHRMEEKLNQGVE